MQFRKALTKTRPQKRTRERDAAFEQFKQEMDGLTEKPQLVDLFQKGYNAQQACATLNIPESSYRDWFESDVEFRVQVYLALCGQ
jgi:hypothetical protein